MAQVINGNVPSTPALHSNDRIAFDLRLRALETLVTGSSPLIATYESNETVWRRASDIVKRLEEALEGSAGEAVKRFIEAFDVNAPLLRPPLPSDALSNGSELSSQVKATMILEAENDIRTTEKDLRELDMLEKRGVAGAGNLAAYESLKEPLANLRRDLPQLTATYASLESDISDLLDRYNRYVNSLSEIFINWNSILTTAEETLTRYERARA